MRHPGVLWGSTLEQASWTHATQSKAKQSKANGSRTGNALLGRGAEGGEVHMLSGVGEGAPQKAMALLQAPALRVPALACFPNATAAHPSRQQQVPSDIQGPQLHVICERPPLLVNHPPP